jgi:hypothetical protein
MFSQFDFTTLYPSPRRYAGKRAKLINHAPHNSLITSNFRLLIFNPDMKRLTICLAWLLSCAFSSLAQSSPKRLLVFSKINRYYHQSIPAGQRAIQEIGSEMGFAVDTTSVADYFTEDSLKNYAAVIFLNTSGNGLLDTSQKADFERYIQAGGGYVGVHGAAATEYFWPWYGQLLG